MRDTDAVFQQFYDGLRLPDYFGWNWDALSDCLRDLKWLSADHHVLIFKAADEALSSNTSGRRLPFKTLLRAGQHWSFTQRPEGIELSKLAIVMACDAGSVRSFRSSCDHAWMRWPRRSVDLMSRTRGRCLRCEVRPGRRLPSSRSGCRCRATASSG
ncbi:barstar family protein [Streptomyces cynarae]|uniref:barstar family protein n=1 Tax=Streptomyces cynarae TaxID=2981134 RepID=UPI0036F3A63B